MGAQGALLFGCPLPSYLLWSLIAAAGAATVLSFAILADYFPKEMSGRANAALNLLHVGAAFTLQTAIGVVINQWPHSEGTYPAEAYQAALGALLGLELAALAWFVAVAAPRPKPQPVSRSLRTISVGAEELICLVKAKGLPAGIAQPTPIPQRFRQKGECPDNVGAKNHRDYRLSHRRGSLHQMHGHIGLS
jgi:MFS family permease